MIRFNNDYSEGAHPKVLEALVKTNLEQTAGYGEDEYCEKARALIQKKCGQKDAAVHFLVGGTQANLTVIAAALRAHQGVLATDTAHIHVHETGSVEATGHKVLALPAADGKLSAGQIRDYARAHYADSAFEHTVQPGMVYLSNPTEIGSLYTKAELTEIRRACDEWRLTLFLDGARLGYGLMAEENDLTLADIAALCDVFYIGGTKVGALFGEAVVITNKALQKDFRYLMKQKGGMLAKGRLLGIQFYTLFEDDLYFKISDHADKLAMKIRAACEEMGFPFVTPSATNQQFPILPDSLLKKLDSEFVYNYHERADETHSAVRFCTSWATTEESVDRLVAALRQK